MHQLETPQATRQQVHWARKYSQEIAIGFFIIAAILAGLALYNTFSGPTQPKQLAPIINGPAYKPPAPAAQRNNNAQSFKPQPSVAPIVQRHIEQPRIEDVPFISSSQINYNGLLSAQVVRIRQLNGYTAITFKVDGSMNDRTGLVIVCPIPGEGWATLTTIIDNFGRKYRLINDVADVPDKFVCTTTDWPFYHLEPHESVYPTYLFEAINPAATSLEIHFASLAQSVGNDFPPIRVVLQ